MKRILTTLLFIVIFSPNFIAQNIGTIRGIITDSTNGEALAYGNILIKELNKGASTDTRGYFLMPSVPAGNTYTLVATYVGYDSKEVKVAVSAGKITHVDILLAPSSLELQTVEKIGYKIAEENATDIGLQRISVKNLEMLPKGVETDVFRSLQYIPGVRSTGDVSARYYVRGGSSNQNLVLLEGVPIYNPFHALGMFSAIDPDLISNIEFYKGGFSAEYGGRISSVLNLIPKDGNKNRFSGKASFSQLTGKASVEGPIPYGSFILTGRKSYSKEIFKKFLNDQDAPIEFYDFSFKLNYSNPEFMPISKFTFTGFFSNDKLDNDSPTQEDFEWSNNLFGFKWFQAVEESPLFLDIGLSFSDFKGTVSPNQSQSKEKNNQLSDVTADMNFTYVFDSKDELGFGLKIKEVKTDLFLENSFGAESVIGSSGSNFSLFAKYKFLRYENFGVDIGTRINAIHFTKKAGGSHLLEPRVSVTYRAIKDIAFKAAWGVYIQELTTLSDETEIISLFEPWIITPDYLEPAKSTHYMVGVEINLLENLSFESEAYYKFARNIPTLNDNKFYSNDPDLVSGSQESYGLEFLLRYFQEPINFTASYAMGYAYKEVDNWLYYPRYDSRHALNFSLEFNIGAGWQASAVWVYNSGLPFTQSIGYYDKFYFDDLYSGNPVYESYKPYALLRDINLGRMPDYHRLDLNISKKFELSFMDFALDFSIINVYDRKNIFYFKRDTGERVNMLPFLPTATVKVEL